MSETTEFASAATTYHPAINWRLAAVHDALAPAAPTSIDQVPAAVAEFYPAEVPGNFELDLIKAGVITADPYSGDGVLEMQRYEDCHIFYSGIFQWSESTTDIQLVLEGVDTIADIYLNGVSLGRCENMLIAHQFLAQGLHQGENELFVHIRPACLEAREIPMAIGVWALRYNHETAVIRKAPHSFGWDIAPRVVSAGLWKPVYFQHISSPRLTETYLTTAQIDKEAETAVLQLRFRADIGREPCRDYSLTVEGRCGDHTFFARENTLWFNSGTISIDVDNVRFWHPRGLGEPNLYQVRVTLYRCGTAVDTHCFQAGIRTVALENTEVLDENGEGVFRFIINGEPVFWRGTNWVPADIFHSKDRERIPQILQLAVEAGCNSIRCWGGGVYEDDIFYDLCDQYGLMIWQDFIMGCAGYPRDRRMQALLEEEATAAVRRLRQHPSICLWAGDNECDILDLPFRDPDQNVLTREILPRVVDQHDSTRPYLPSSPYISGAAWHSGKRDQTTEQHTWGPRDYFKGDYYRNVNPCFASEVGYHGCPSPSSIRKMMDPDFCWPPENNPQWVYHCVSPEFPEGPYVHRVPLMQKQVAYLFGDTPDNLEDFAAMSQISQAEADKFFVEKYRIAKGHSGGIIWWNIMDCWPQLSDAVVDYYFEKKLAFSYLQASQQLICLMMDDLDGDLTLYGVNDSPQARSVQYRVEDVLTGELLVSGQNQLGLDQAERLFRGPKPKENRFYKIVWDVLDSRGEILETGENHYLSFFPTVDYSWYRRCMQAMDSYQFHGFI